MLRNVRRRADGAMLDAYKGTAFHDFVMRAMQSSHYKVLDVSKQYPATLVNFIPILLNTAGVAPNQCAHIEEGPTSLALHLNDGRIARVQATIV